MMNTGRFPRTLEEAFGPYTSHRIVDADPAFDWSGVIIIIGCAVLAFSPYIYAWFKS